jgi:hypothetical protein
MRNYLNSNISNSRWPGDPIVTWVRWNKMNKIRGTSTIMSVKSEETTNFLQKKLTDGREICICFRLLGM